MMHRYPTTTPAEWAEQLRAHGLRVTSGRVAALGYIEAHPHSSVSATHAALSKSLPSLSQQSVHNITHDLTDCGLLRRVDLPDAGSALYETRAHDNHHHVQCVVCHRIENIDCEIGVAPCINPDETRGMRLIEATVTYRGVCADCEGSPGAARFPAAPPSESPQASPHGNYERK